MYASDYRRIARDNLKPNWKLSIGVALLASLLGGLLMGAGFLPELELKIEEQNIHSLHDVWEYIITHGRTAIEFSSVLNFVHFILGGVIQLGYSIFLLKQHDRQNPQLNDLFSKFDYFGAGFCQAFLRGLYTFLWGLLFIIPGIVAQYSYAMTPFIMAEHPEMTASEAISASKRMMDGRKGALFCLELSFIGWDLLCVLTLNLGHIALNPYKNAAMAAFYRQISRTDPYNEL